MTAHGVTEEGVEVALQRSGEAADRPTRSADASLWFQFETGLPISLTPWAEEAEHRVDDWPTRWGSYRSHYTPPGLPTP